RAVLHLGIELLRHEQHPLELERKRHHTRDASEAINGRLEHLRGSALGFRNLTHYVARSLLEAGGFRPLLHSHSR
ncbi:ISL3 family transposase, partial [Dermacoccus nishinomiyaensis]